MIASFGVFGMKTFPSISRLPPLMKCAPAIADKISPVPDPSWPANPKISPGKTSISTGSNKPSGHKLRTFSNGVLDRDEILFGNIFSNSLPSMRLTSSETDNSCVFLTATLLPSLKIVIRSQILKISSKR